MKTMAITNPEKKWWIFCIYPAMALTFFYDWLLVGNGLFHSGMVPMDSNFISGEQQAYLISLAIEFAVLMFYIHLPSFKVFRINSAVSTILIVVFLFISLFAAMFSLTLRAGGDAYATKLEYGLSSIQKKITAVNKQMAITFEQTSKSREQRANQLKYIDKDDHILKCGIRCRKELIIANEEKRKFSALGKVEIPVLVQDTNEEWTNIGRRMSETKYNVALFKQFVNDQNLIEPIRASISDIQAEIDALGSKYFASPMSSTKTGIVVAESYQNIGKALTLNFKLMEPITIACLIIGLIPHMLGLYFGLMIRRLTYANEDMIQESMKVKEEQILGAEIIDTKKKIEMQDLFHNVYVKANKAFHQATDKWDTLFKK
jgi:hypothetical protein